MTSDNVKGFGPTEDWTSDEIDAWLRKMIRWHLITRRYVIRNGEGDWYYHNSRLSTYLILPVLRVLTRIGLLKEENHQIGAKP